MAKFMDHVGQALGSRPQRKRFAQYALGLLLPGERKSMEPMAARIDPEHAMARFKTFQHFIACSDWDDLAVRQAAYRWAEPALAQAGPMVAWVIDDTGFLKKGMHSVFVSRQYTGTAGKVCNCQVAVSLTVATETLSMPLDFELYMPEVWAKDFSRREEAKVPRELWFRPKPEIALELIEEALRIGVPRAPVVVDSNYGTNGPFRAELEQLGLEYVAEVASSTTVLPPGAARPVSVRRLGARMQRRSFRRVSWREGTKGTMSAHFALRRVRLPAPRGGGSRTEAERLLLIERAEAESAPRKYWLVRLHQPAALEQIVSLAHCRWRIERDYQDLKEELGLDHYEGRSYVGWNHHVSICLAAYAFVLRERALGFPPGAERFERLLPTAAPARPRGSAAAA
jgi:SRSO17 transposase